MTSLAFIMGVFPLAIATRRAGSEMRRAIGVAVFAGMLGVTLFGLALTPVFYWTIRRLSGGKLKAGRFSHRRQPTPALPQPKGRTSRPPDIAGAGSLPSRRNKDFPDMNILRPLLIAASTLTLAACVVGPAYHAPDGGAGGHRRRSPHHHLARAAGAHLVAPVRRS